MDLQVGDIQAGPSPASGASRSVVVTSHYHFGQVAGQSMTQKEDGLNAGSSGNTGSEVQGIRAQVVGGGGSRRRERKHVSREV